MKDPNTVTRHDSLIDSGFHWGKRIALVYVAFAVATLGFVVFALTRSVHLVRTDYYEHSLDYSRTQEARQHTSQKADSFFIKEQDAESVLFQLEPDVKVSVLCCRPDNPTLDKILTIHTNHDGVYRLPPGTLQSGQWRIVASWTSGGIPYEMEERLYLWNR